MCSGFRGIGDHCVAAAGALPHAAVAGGKLAENAFADQQSKKQMGPRFCRRPECEGLWQWTNHKQ